jgi:hypothetical protein
VLLPQGASIHTVLAAEELALVAGRKLRHSQEVEVHPSLGCCLGIFGWYLLEVDGVLQLVGFGGAWGFVAGQRYSLSNLEDDQGRWVADSSRTGGGWWWKNLEEG